MSSSKPDGTLYKITDKGIETKRYTDLGEYVEAFNDGEHCDNIESALLTLTRSLCDRIATLEKKLGA